MADSIPTVPLTGAADILGVSRQRAHQLSESDAAFPAPLLVTDLGRRWARADIEAYAESRKPTPTEETPA